MLLARGAGLHLRGEHLGGHGARFKLPPRQVAHVLEEFVEGDGFPAQRALQFVEGVVDGQVVSV